MRTRLLRVLGVGVAITVTLVAIPGSAYALGDGSRTLLKNYSNQLCMGVSGGDRYVQDGTAIITWTCDGTNNQTWIFSLADPNQPNGPYVIQNSVAPTECLSVAAKSTSPGARLVLWHCKPASDNQDQLWYLSSDRGAPYVYLSNVNADLMAAALNSGRGAPVALEPQGPTWFPLEAWLGV
jgi:hypothetical protein